MRHYTRLLCALSCVASLATQASRELDPRSVVVPAGWSDKPGYAGNVLTWPQRDLPIHAQFGWHVDDLKIGRAVLRSIAFRPHNYPWYRIAPVTTRMVVYLSTGPTRPLAFSDVFARNEGPDRRQVFYGNVSWPAWTPVVGIPDFVVRIPFATPFPFDASRGRSLVFDARVSSSTGTTDWQYDVAARDVGRFVDYNPPYPSTANVFCNDHRGGGNYWFWSWPSRFYPGGDFTLTMGGGLPNAPAVSTLGSVGAGWTWNGVDLPIDLGPLGAPRCVWATASVAWLPFRFDQSGTGRPAPVPIPNHPSVVGAHFFEQTLILDPLANALGAITPGGLEFEIGSGLGPDVQTLAAFKDTPPRPNSDRIWKGAAAPIVRFEY